MLDSFMDLKAELRSKACEANSTDYLATASSLRADYQANDLLLHLYAFPGLAMNWKVLSRDTVRMTLPNVISVWESACLRGSSLKVFSCQGRSPPPLKWQCW